MKHKVVILGGGVAGMSAAHELLERGFEVHIYERKAIPGGKARSVPVPGSGRDGRKDLPGEHGFRFFPRFYTHLPDTMQRIPYGENGQSVYDNLVGTTRLEYPRVGKAPIVLVDRFPSTLTEWQLVFQDAFKADFGFAPGEQAFFAERLWQIVTSCAARRLNEYEKLNWWDFVGAATRSEAYQRYLAGGLTRSLNAAQAKYASTRTIGDILVQLLLDMVTPGISSDRVLNGPTNEVWMDPWLRYLEGLGGHYYRQNAVQAINCQDGRVASVTIAQGERVFEVTGDYYIAALPIEVMASLITAEMLRVDPTLQGILAIDNNTQWMNGIQFYLKDDVPLVYGHELYVDSPWALTSFSQAQFWPGHPLRDYGDGTVRGVLSVDISEWMVKGSREYTGGKTAMECTHEEIANETWHQLKASLNRAGETVLADDNLRAWFLDPDIVRYYGHHHLPAAGPYQPYAHPADDPQRRETNLEPLLVNYINSWQYRPDAYTRIPNLFLAADYVRTNTDLATMEGANEAARRAVNGILDAAGSSAGLCQLWQLHEPEVLAPWRSSDAQRYAAGLPWNGKIEFPSGWLGLLRRL